MRSDAPASITTSASAANLDADDPIDDSDANSDSDSDSDDDTAALMAELQKIKREKVFLNLTLVMIVFLESSFKVSCRFS